MSKDPKFASLKLLLGLDTPLEDTRGNGKKKLKEKHKFRLQDFAAFPKHTMDASQGKDHFAIPFQIVKQEDGQKRLMALVLYYKGSKAGTFTEKSSSYKKRTK